MSDSLWPHGLQHARLPVHHQLLELTQTHVHRVSDAIQPFHPCNPRDSQQSSPPSQFKSINSSALSFLYSPTLTSIMATGKTIALTRWTFVGKVMSLLFNMLSGLVITFLTRSKCLLISWPQSPSMDISLSRLWELVKDREAWHSAPFDGIVKNQTQLSEWTATVIV